MINNIRIDLFKREYKNFKNSQDYKFRESQRRFTEIARQVIKELVKKEEITNEDLTALIQMFGFNCKKETFLKYLKKLGFSEKLMNEIYDKFLKYGESGYTGRGKAAIRNLNEAQLEEVKNFLISIVNADTKEKVKKAFREFRDKQIPQVTYGIFSPWLHYIKPTICPLVAGNASKFLKKLGWKGDYEEAIDRFEELKKLVEEEDLGFIDIFLLDKKNLDDLIENSERSETERLETDILDILEKKKQIIFYGPPGTGKTYVTKRFAIYIMD
jgi:SpoVK/Ycf46/Vps4 family AAA+-type ATPase